MVTGRAAGRRKLLQLAATAPGLLVLPRSLRAQEDGTVAANGALSRQARVAAFDEIWTTVRDRFYDPHLHGLDWSAVRSRFLPEVERATSENEVARLVNAMLSELGASHTHFYTPDDPEYYQLADIFAGSLQRHGLEQAFPAGKITYPGIGILSRATERLGSLVTGVIDGSPGQQAGLTAGDHILSADGASFAPVQSFKGQVGKPVALTVVRAAATLTLAVTPVELEPHRMFLDGLNASARLFEANGRRIGYVHVWSYASRAYQRALQDLLSTGRLKEADALIWDLRDGWGGAIPEYLDLFSPRAPTLLLTDHDGDTAIENYRWRKPTAMLINGGSRSGKEILAYGFKKYRLGEVIGTRTEGAVLAATSFLLGGGLLLLAVDDVLVDGERLEGVGVEPTIEVRNDDAGGDPQLNRAIALLSGN